MTQKQKTAPKQDVIEYIQEQITYAQKYNVRLRYISIRHDQVLELAELFVTGTSDKQGYEDWEVKQRAIDAINQGTAKWQGLPIVVVGGEDNA